MLFEQEFAKIPQNMGDYDELVAQGVNSFGIKERVFRYGCEWESKVENNTYAPATLNESTGVITPDTTHWRHVSGSYEMWLVDHDYGKISAANVKDANQGNKSQQTINSEVGQEIADLETAVGTGGTVDQKIAVETSRAQNAESALGGRVTTLETAVGSGGSVDSRIAAAKAEIKGNATSACDTLGEAEALISAEATARANAVSAEASRAQAAEEQLRTLYNNLQQSQPIPVTALPATGDTGKIYRLAGTNSYADYMYAEGALTTPIKMAEYDNAIDNTPIAGSNNLVKSGGVYGVVMENYNRTVSEGAELIPDSIISGKFIRANGSLIDQSEYSIKVYNVSSEKDHKPYIKKEETPGIGVAAALWCQNSDGTGIVQIVPKVEGGTLEFYNKPVGANYLLVNSIPTISRFNVTVFSTNDAGEEINGLEEYIDENLEDIYIDEKKAGFEIAPTYVLSGKYLNINGVLVDQSEYSVKVYDFSNEVEGGKFFRIGKTPGMPDRACESVWCQNADGSGVLQIQEIRQYSESRIYIKPEGANYLLLNTVPSLEGYNPKVCTVITNNNVPQFIVDCYGDSFTHAGVYETTLASLISENIRYAKVNNYGVSGQKTAGILRRFGSIPMPIYEKFTIPASGSVTIKVYTPYEVSSYYGLEPEAVHANVNPVIIAGVKGNITDETSLENNVKQYTFTRLESGSAVNVSKNTIVGTKGMYERLPDVTVFYAGTNDDIDSKKTLILDELKKATERVSNGKFLVLGLHKERSEYGIDFTIQDVINFNKGLLDTFGSKFIDVLSYMNECALSDAGITPTQEDIQRISEGKCPRSITTDGLHFTTKGYELVGLLIYRSILSNGYIY